MSMSKRIALIFDCDGTISEDTTTKLLKHVGLTPRTFWSDARRLERDGWEPALAYMHLLIQYARKKPITAATFKKVAKKVVLSGGIPKFFFDMKAYVARRFGRQGVSLDVFVVSGGIEEILRATALGRRGRSDQPAVDDFFGCRFAYDDSGNITFPRVAITFTEKTKALFAINKGISSTELAADPYRVNDHVSPDERQVSLKNMIYIGDGPTDVPCMSLLKQQGCEIFAVYTQPRQGILQSTNALARQGRFTRGPFKRDYRSGSDLRRALEGELEGYAERIITEAAPFRKPAVRHDQGPTDSTDTASAGGRGTSLRTRRRNRRGTVYSRRNLKRRGASN